MFSTLRAIITGLIGSLGFAALANAAADCTIGAGPVGFGVYDPLLATPDDSTGSIVVTCNNNPPPGLATVIYQLRLSRGLSATFSPRQMASGAARLNYYLYTDTARSQVWGDGTSGTSTVYGLFLLNGNATRSRTHTVYGRVPALQDPALGSYADVIVVTVEF